MKHITAIAVAFTLLLVPSNGFAKCEMCGGIGEAYAMETHIFEDEYDHGTEIYELNICPACVGEIE